MIHRDKLKRKLAQGPVFGTFINIAAASVPETLALSGLDFGIIDLEHAAIDDPLVESMIRAGDVHDFPLLVRPAELSRSGVQHALDQGACGVQVPQLYTMEEARQAVRFSKYPPLGVRGTAGVRAAAYGVELMSYLKQANDWLLTVVHCETKEFLEIMPQAARLPGLDCIFLGPFDLSVALGYPGEIDHPTVTAAIADFIDICNQANMAAGIYVRHAQEAKYRIRQGFRFIAYAVDIILLRAKFADFVQAVTKE